MQPKFSDQSGEYLEWVCGRLAIVIVILARRVIAARVTESVAEVSRIAPNGAGRRRSLAVSPIVSTIYSVALEVAFAVASPVWHAVWTAPSRRGHRGRPSRCSLCRQGGLRYRRRSDGTISVIEFAFIRVAGGVADLVA